MIDPLWSPSRKTENTPAYQDLQGHVMSAMERGDIDEIRTDWYDGARFDSDDEALEDIVTEIHEHSMIMPFSERDYAEVSKLLSVWEDLRWGYGEKDDPTGLFPYEVATTHKPLTLFDVAVLAGLVGADIMDKNKNADKLSEKLTDTPRQKGVLLGSVAMAAQSERYKRHYPGLELEDVNGLESRVEFYADFNGDFQMRHIHTFDIAIDPFASEQAYAPELTPNIVYGYHSVEPQILTNILVHQARLLKRGALHGFADEVFRDINQRSLTVTPGAFGDYGHHNDEEEVWQFKEFFVNGEDYTHQDMIVYPSPYSTTRLRVESKDEGIAFYNVDIEHDNKGEQIHIPNSKIGELVAALIESACDNGRTSPATLLAILDIARQSD